MNILVISQFYFPEPFRIADICEELSNRGHDVTVICALPNYPKGEIYDGYTDKKRLNEMVSGVHVIRCFARPRHQGNINLGLSYLSYMYQANKAVKKLTGPYDAVFVYQLSPIFIGVPGGKAKDRFGIPELLYCLDIWPESVRDVFQSENSVFYKIVKRISTSIYQKADKIGVTSISFIPYLKNKCGISESKMTYIPQHAEDTYLSIPEKADTDDIAHFAFMGNMSVSQNLSILIRAASMLDVSMSFHLDFIGNGPEEMHLQELVNSLNLSEKVTFHGRHTLEEMPAFYEMADVCFVSLEGSSGISETIPGKLQGYMAAGKPILAAIAGPARELVCEAQCGICVPPDDIDALAKAMKTYILKLPQLRVLGANGRRYFKDHFTKSIFVDAIEHHLNQLIENNHKRKVRPHESITN